MQALIRILRNRDDYQIRVLSKPSASMAKFRQHWRILGDPVQIVLHRINRVHALHKYG